MRMYIFSIALLSLVSTGCNTADSRSLAGAEAPGGIAVGPVPGTMSSARELVNPHANDPVALQDGQRLFNWYNCSGCHGGHAGGGMGPSLRDATWIYGNRPDQIFDTIAQGRSNGMPAWGTKIPEDQIWQLVTYIKSLGTPQEPEPPVVPADEDPANPNYKSPVSTTSPPIY